MSLSARNQKHLDAIMLVETVSASLKTISWVWGGFTTDIYMGRILREHDDLDYLTLNLHSLKPRLVEAFSGNGWQAEELENDDLSLKKEDVKVHLGHVEAGRFATWTHNGAHGSLCFPVSWLSPDIVKFYEVNVHVVAAELQYVLKEHQELLNPGWHGRTTDIIEKECLRDILLKRGIEVDLLHTLVTSGFSSGERGK